MFTIDELVGITSTVTKEVKSMTITQPLEYREYLVFTDIAYNTIGSAIVVYQIITIIHESSLQLSAWIHYKGEQEFPESARALKIA